MAKIVWIASYPRSGNTWMRFLLANLLYGRVESSSHLQQLVPDIHRALSGTQIYGPRKTLIKTHWRYVPDLPLREDTIGAIHILRHPIDVMMSNLNYVTLRGNLPARLPSDEMRTAFERRWIDDYIAAGGYPRWREMGFGSWEENVRSWTEETPPYPRLVLRYEDMRADVAGATAKVIRFLGVEADGPTVAAAIERSSFAAMRVLEEQEIAQEREGIFFDPGQRASLAAGLRFVRGGGTAPLSADQRRRALERFAPLMERYGYAAEASR